MSYSAEELAGLKKDYVIDAIGEVCPHTLDLALKGLKKAQPGEIVVEVTDHTIATKTIPAAVKMNKQAEFLGIIEEKGNYHIYLKKN
ncbi:sulfurtransferase TusA family protein [Paenibacillus sp. FA6]|uniref:sulfurtransferase TusA family protein n=1 Tax=Paenibacillus sp. FA6 TaxID=3413029 RepID=UPI003F65C814